MQSFNFEKVEDAKMAYNHWFENVKGEIYSTGNGFIVKSKNNPGISLKLNLVDNDQLNILVDNNDTLKKRIDRRLELRKTEEPKIFFYHHRSNCGFKEDILEILKTGGCTLEHYYSSAYFIYFTQEIINQNTESRGYRFEITKQNQIFLTLVPPSLVLVTLYVLHLHVLFQLEKHVQLHHVSST